MASVDRAARWNQFFDELQAQTAALESALPAPTDGESPVRRPTVAEPQPWVAPADLGPLPVGLAPRAEAVLASLREASERARAAQEDVVRQLAALRQVRPTDDSGARYLDVSG